MLASKRLFEKSGCREPTQHQTRHQPVIEAGRAEAPAFAQHRKRHVVYQQVDQHGGAPHQPHIIAFIGVLKTAVERFDGGGAELYPDSWVYPPIELLGTCSVRDTPVCSRQPALNFQFIF